MNIFEYLGLDENHRKLSNKVTQYVKHWDEVSDSKKKGKTFGLQVKKDGVCALTVVTDDGKTVAIFSRTGKRFTSTESIVAEIVKVNLQDGVYMGEMWVPKSVASLEETSGTVNPNRVNALSPKQAEIAVKLRMSFFDRVETRCFIDGTCPTPYEVRDELLHWDNPLIVPERVDILTTKYVNSEDEIHKFADEQVALGEEGIVIRDAAADWEAGHKGWRVMKLVRGVDYDLKCIGFEEGTGKYAGKVANLLFNWKGGVTIKCMLGKGWTHDMAEAMYHACTYISPYTPTVVHPNSPIGRIFQVYALEESSKGKLRLAKVGEKRHDKEESDV